MLFFLCLLRTNLSYLRILSVSSTEICRFSVAEDFPMHLPFPHIPSAVTGLLTFFLSCFFPLSLILYFTNALILYVLSQTIISSLLIFLPVTSLQHY